MFPKLKNTTAGLLAAVAAGACALAASAPAQAAVAGIQYLYTVSFAAGSQSATNVQVTPVTAVGKILVVQTLSIYRFPASASTLQCFLAVPAGAGTGYVAIPDINSPNDFYPATTLNLTAYVNAGRNAYVNCYRTGSALPVETDYVTVSGNITTP
jgi:hypothetical protein